MAMKRKQYAAPRACRVQDAHGAALLAGSVIGTGGNVDIGGGLRDDEGSKDPDAKPGFFVRPRTVWDEEE